uniref:Uncharacterized protein n=1 Tax=Leersia perrieri TaxID=77586 RepID=A0A0D9X7K1_9ORYZ
MSKEEDLKIQKKVKKILHKIEGVYQTSIDAEQGKKLQQLQQQLQMKGLKLPQFMDDKMPPFAAAAAPTKDPKSVKLNIPEDDFVDNDSEFDDEEDFHDDGLDDDYYDNPKMIKQMAMPPPNTGDGGHKKGGNNGGKMGGENEIPVQIKGNTASGSCSKQNQGGRGGNGKNGGGQQTTAKVEEESLRTAAATTQLRERRAATAAQSLLLVG